MNTGNPKTYEESLKAGHQAVIIAESFGSKFKPITYERSKTMLPLANIPLLQYAIEFLVMNHVTDLIIASGASGKPFKAIEQFISNLQKQANNPGRYKTLKIKLVKLDDASCLGNALREIDQYDEVREDFILMQGDIISNADLQEALKMHFKHKTEDKERKVILTKVFHQVPFSSAIRDPSQELVLMVDNQTKEILDYGQFEKGKSKFHINKSHISLKKQIRQYQLRSDLIDTEISICTKDLLNHMTDDHTQDTIKEEFINYINASEIIDDKIMSYVLPNNVYYGRVWDPRTYQAITRDVIARKCSPMVLDSSIMKRQYTAHLFNKYIEPEVDHSISTEISNNCVISRKTTIGSGSKIFQSSIGSKCKIGKNVSIRNCIIWDNVVIEDDCVLENSLVCDKSHIKAGAQLKDGTMLSFNVVVKSGVTVEGIASCYSFNAEQKGFMMAETSDEKFFENGVLSFLPRDMKIEDYQFIGAQSPYRDEPESDLEESDDEELQGKNQQQDFFNKEVIDVFNKIIEKQTTLDIGLMDIKNLKLSDALENSECLEGIMPAMLDLVVKSVDAIETNGDEAQADKDIRKSAKTIIESNFNLFNAFLVAFVHSQNDQFQIISLLEEYCEANERILKCFDLAVWTLYQNDVVTAATLLSWSENAKRSLANPEDEEEQQRFEDISEENLQKLLKISTQVITFFESEKKKEEEAAANKGADCEGQEGEEEEGEAEYYDEEGDYDEEAE